MGFTACMDDFDDESFVPPALFSAPAAPHARRAAAVSGEAGRRRVEGSREEQLLGSATSPHAVRVRGLEEGERGRIQQEAQLLATLEVAGVVAAPAVLELEDEGYVREVAPVLGRQVGRRAAEAGTPPTGERRAVARARESLDELIGALHERGWVLGAPHGCGLGVRSDGSVLALELDGLRREQSLSARQADRRWVDSVLQDQDRTLRRRVHLGRERTEQDALVLGGEPSSQGSRHLPEPALAAVEQDAASVPQPAPSQPASSPSSLPVPRRRRRDAAESRPQPSVSESPADRPAVVPAGSGADHRVGAAIQEVLRQPRLRRTAVFSGALVLLLGAVVGLGAWWAQDRDEPSTEREQPVATVPTEAAPAPAPSIEEPQVLVAELAGTRHAYVTGISDLPASAPGSAALAEDERVRDAYTGTTVRTGGPVVHSAEVIEQPGSSHTAVLHAVTSMQELHLQEADGGSATVPASAAVTVRLVLEWDGEQWRIVSAAQLQAAAAPRAP